MIKAFLFGIDGVLTDSSDISKHLVVRYFAGKGIRIDASTVIPSLGKGMRALFEETARANGIAFDLSQALSFFKEHYRDELSLWGPMPGAMEFISTAKKEGIKAAAVSSAPRWRVEENLSYIGIDSSFFDAVITGEDVRRNKPYPDIWMKALVELGLDASDAVVFEDSEAGIKSAKRAGLYVAALTGTLGRDRARECGADALLDSFQSFPSFSSASDISHSLSVLEGKGRNAVKYGANWIEPLERRLPQSVVEKEAIEKALECMHRAYAPYSHFRVGAAVLSASSGKIYGGCNVENVSYGATICAERNAITSAVANEGPIGIDLIVVASEASSPAKPCAVCLQVMSEFILPSTPVILVNTEGRVEKYRFSDLLPDPFKFEE